MSTSLICARGPIGRWPCRRCGPTPTGCPRSRSGRNSMQINKTVYQFDIGCRTPVLGVCVRDEPPADLFRYPSARRGLDAARRSRRARPQVPAVGVGVALLTRDVDGLEEQAGERLAPPAGQVAFVRRLDGRAQCVVVDEIRLRLARAGEPEWRMADGGWRMADGGWRSGLPGGRGAGPRRDTSKQPASARLPSSGRVRAAAQARGGGRQPGAFNAWTTPISARSSTAST
jgi:hypothetical protein